MQEARPSYLTKYPGSPPLLFFPPAITPHSKDSHEFIAYPIWFCLLWSSPCPFHLMPLFDLKRHWTTAPFDSSPMPRMTFCPASLPFLSAVCCEELYTACSVIPCTEVSPDLWWSLLPFSSVLQCIFEIRSTKWQCPAERFYLMTIIFSMLFSIPFLILHSAIWPILTTEQILFFFFLTKASESARSPTPCMESCDYFLSLILSTSFCIYIYLISPTTFVQLFSIAMPMSAVLQTILTQIPSYSSQNLCFLHPHSYLFFH